MLSFQNFLSQFKVLCNNHETKHGRRKETPTCINKMRFKGQYLLHKLKFYFYCLYCTEPHSVLDPENISYGITTSLP